MRVGWGLVHRDVRIVFQGRILCAVIVCTCFLLSACFHTENHPPTANASVSKTTPSLGDVVTLDGSLSSDVDGDKLEYEWEVVTRPFDSQSQLSDLSEMSPTLLIDKDGAYQVKLVVSDGERKSKADFVNFSTINFKPKGEVIVSPPTQGEFYVAGDKIELDASSSSDPENQDLFYNWNLAAKPDGSQAFLDNDKAVKPSFIADVAGQYIVHLVVDDGEQTSVTKTVQFKVISADDPPVAIAKDVTSLGGRHYVVGDTILMDGSESYDPENQPLIYRWDIFEKPPNSLAQLSGTNGITSSFRADQPGHFIIHLYVDDGGLQSRPASLIFEIEKPERRSDTRPFAEAGPDQPLYSANTIVQLDGSLSYDVENDDLIYKWEMLTKPQGSFAQLSNPNAAKPQFTADILGSYVAQLVVSDINGDSHIDVVVATPHEDPKLACGDCHNNEITRGKAADHLLNYDDCAACHFTDGFVPTKGTFHAHGHKARPSQCVVCHDGIAAKTKPADHIETDKDCNYCHLISNGTWVPALRVPGNPAFSHTGIFSGCVDCHDNVIQQGKPDGHMPVSNRCSACHAVNSWTPARHLEHTQALGACMNCHAPDQGERVQPSNHLKTSNNCTACHTEDTWVPILRVDHNQVVGSCVSCHDGVRLIAGKPISSKSIAHIESSSFCDKCHNTISWLEISITHDFFTGACIDCHNGIVSTGAPDTHTFKFSQLCESCHNELNWIAAVDHGQVLGTCQACHDQPGGGFQDALHIPTTNQCEACHGTVVWTSLIAIDHTEVIGTCIDCHNNVLAQWKSSLHLNATNDCDACHSINSFIPAVAVDHNMVLGLCAECHNGASSFGQMVNHISTSDLCEACHATTAFIPAILLQHDEVVGACVTCHNGVIAHGKASLHIVSSDNCGACHSAVAWVPTRQINHSEVIGECLSCHGDPVNSVAVPASHSDPILFPNVDECGACHSTFRWQVSVFPVGHELATNSCAKAGCHDGVAAPEKTASHIDATSICEACHNNTNFSSVNVVNHLEVVGECVDCHNNSISVGQSTGHISASDNCLACHTTQMWKPVNIVDHVEVMGDCFSCHNGTNATGKSSSHIPSDNVCQNCHDKFVWTNILLSLEAHNLLAPKTCVSSDCHTAGISHAPSVVEDCSSCHIVADWLNWARPTTQRAVPPVTPLL